MDATFLPEPASDVGDPRCRGDAGALAGTRVKRTRFWIGRPEIGDGLRLQSFRDRMSYLLAQGEPGQLKRECRDPEPGDPERPCAHHVGQIVHAEHDSADPDQRNCREDHSHECRAAPAAGGR